MKSQITQLTDRYGSASLRAELPPAPHGEIANLARRACTILHQRDRWKYVGKALLMALVAFAFLFAGVISRNDSLVLCAFLGFVAAIVLAFRLSPARLDGQAAQTEGDMERVISSFDIECQIVARSFSAAARDSIKQEGQNLIQTGFSLVELAKWREETRNLFHQMESKNATGLSACQEVVKTAREELRRKRHCLTNAGRGLRAQFIPGRARRAARDAVNAGAQLAEARIEEGIVKAQVHATHAIAEHLASGDSIKVTVSNTQELQRTPVWLGTPLPSAEALEAEASQLVENNIKSLRAKIIESGDKEALTAEIENLFNDSLLGPRSVEEYVASLNGDGGEWAERILREATPFSPVSPFAGKPRFRKLLVMTAGSTNSAVFRNLREALSDQALQIVAREHPDTDVLCVEDEWCLCAGEFPEIVELIKEFRALPAAQQSLLCTACEPADLRSFFPELPQDHTRPTRLLASARVFNVIRRSGSENYALDEVIIGKGYRAALETITLDHALTANIAARVEAVVSRDGVSAALAKLSSAMNDAASFVPKEFVKLFKAGVNEAVIELNRCVAKN